MKYTCRIFLALACSGALLGEGIDAESLPEPSKPPYQVGALPLESGYTIEREGQPDINLRFVDNRMRLYWLDEDGLVVAPEVERATVRLTRVLRGRDFHSLSRLADEAALGVGYPMPPPHRYRGTLVLSGGDSEAIESYTFRYTPDMHAVQPEGGASAHAD